MDTELLRQILCHFLQANDMNMKTSKKGFTLVELMVSISIIGLLSSIALASLNSARLKGNDVKRISDLHQIQLALETYYSTNGTYPIATTYRGTCSSAGGYSTSGPTGWIPGLAPTYIPELPVETNPNGGNVELCYKYFSPTGIDYMVMTESWAQGYDPYNHPNMRLVQPPNFAVYSPSAGANSPLTVPGSY